MSNPRRRRRTRMARYEHTEIVEHAQSAPGISDEAREVARLHGWKIPRVTMYMPLPCRHLNSAPSVARGQGTFASVEGALACAVSDFFDKNMEVR